jgi:hypothetical protein
MTTIGPVIAAPVKIVLGYAERLIAGVSAADFGRLARPGGQVVQSNHPAFVLGHLCLYPPRVLEHLGRPLGAAACPPGYEPLFKNGVECTDDPDGNRYPAMSELTARFFEGYRAATDAVAAASDESLLAPNPTEGRMRELFPTLGGMLNFYLNGHAMSHLGQLSAWRRAMGLPPA